MCAEEIRDAAEVFDIFESLWPDLVSDERTAETIHQLEGRVYDDMVRGRYWTAQSIVHTARFMVEHQDLGFGPYDSRRDH